MASHTPNLDLLKKDPITDGSQTFNIETMLNENWDKIDSAVGQVREELANVDIPLSDATNGNRSDVAASEKAVGQVMSTAQAAQTTANAANTAAAAAQTRADAAFQLGNERKAEVVAALVAKGISASTSESWDSLISKMAGVIKATGNAVAADVLSGKTFSNASGNNLTGTMANQGAKAITPGTANKAISAGYHNGSGYVVGEPNLIAGNLPKDKTFWGIVGALERMTTAEKQAIANAITSKNVPASVNDTNTVLAQKIGQIVTGKRWASGTGMTVPVTWGNFEIRGLNFTPRIVIVHATYTISFEPYYWFKFYDPDDMTLHGCTVQYANNTLSLPTGNYRNPITIYPDGFSGNVGYGTISYEFKWKAYE